MLQYYQKGVSGLGSSFEVSGPQAHKGGLSSVFSIDLFQGLRA